MSGCRPTVPHENSTPTNHRAMPSLCSPHHASHTLCTNTEVRQNPVHNIIISRTMHALMFSRAQTTDIFFADLLKLHIICRLTSASESKKEGSDVLFLFVWFKKRVLDSNVQIITRQSSARSVVPKRFGS